MSYWEPGLWLCRISRAWMNTDLVLVSGPAPEASCLVVPGQVSLAPWPSFFIYRKGMRDSALFTLVQSGSTPRRSQGRLHVTTDAVTVTLPLTDNWGCPSQQPWQRLLLNSHLTFSVSSEWERKSDGGLWTGQAEALPELCLLYPSFPGHTLQGTCSQGQQVPFSGRLHISCLSWGKLVLPLNLHHWSYWAGSGSLISTQKPRFHMIPDPNSLISFWIS